MKFYSLILATVWGMTLSAVGQSPEPSPSTSPTAATEATNPSGRRAREFQGDDLSQVLRLLARQAKISLMIDDAIKGNLNVRFENASAMEAIEAIAHQYKLKMTRDDKGIYYLSSPDDSTAVLDLLAKPETAARVAAFKYNLYNALRQHGLSPDEAIRLTYETDLKATLSALGKKPEAAAAK